MTLEDNNLKIWRDAISDRPDCISLDELQQCLEGTGSGESVRHVAECPHCQASLAMLRRFESRPEDQEASDVAWIVSRLRHGKNTPAAAAPPSRRRLLSFPYLMGGLAAVLAIGLGISILVNRAGQPAAIVDPSGPETMRSAAVHLIIPSGTVSQAPANFQWEAFPGTAVYSVQLMEIDGSLLWSGSSSENSLPVPAVLNATLRPGKPLLWKVAALDSSGKTIATSNQERFMIKAPTGNIRR
jgi:hypothetical protein